MLHLLTAEGASITFETFERDAMDWLATEVDDRGFTKADCLLIGVDEGGAAAGAPPMPGGAVGVKAIAARRKRVKGSYGWLAKHQGDRDYVKDHLHTNHFQNGPAVWAHLVTFRAAINPLTLRDMDAKWNGIDLAADVGVAKDSMMQLAKVIRTKNARRPVGNAEKMKPPWWT